MGIGTATPTAKLHVEVPAGYSNPLFKVTAQGAPNPYLIILPNGNVGIGIANPTEALDVAGNIQFSGALMPGGSAGSVGQVLVSQGPGVPPQWQDASTLGDNWGSQVAQTAAPIIGDGTAGSPITLQPGMSSGEVLIYNGTTWTIRQAPWDSVCNTAVTNMIQKWTGSELCNSQIYDDGTNVGIGTTNPTHKLHVAGDVYVQDSLRIDGDLRPGGNPGSPGQVLVSQGAGLPPVWKNITTCNTIIEYGPFVNTNGDSVAVCSVAMTFNQCVQACHNSTYKGKTDWRVAFIDELYEYKSSGGVDYNISAGCYHWAGPATGVGIRYYLFRPSDNAWSFNVGSNNSYCRCVR